MKLGTKTKKSKSVDVYKDGELFKKYETMSCAARDLQIKVQNIYKALNGYKTTLKGYEFKWSD